MTANNNKALTQIVTSEQINALSTVKPFEGDITIPFSPTLSVGMDCLKLNSRKDLTPTTLQRKTLNAINKYPADHAMPIVLASMLAIINTEIEIEELREYLITLITEVDDNAKF